MKQRNSNLEILRIISMCGIVVMHYFNSDLGGAIQNPAFPDFSWFISHAANAFCIPLVNCFVLITGFFLIDKTTFSLRKPLEIFIITAFYGAAAYLIAWLLGAVDFSPALFLTSVFPFAAGKRWFVETYIILILFAPFLSAMLRNLNEKSYRLLLIIQLCIFSVWYSLGFSAPVLDDGYGIINFVTLYLLGGYIRLHGAQIKLFSLRRSWYLFIYCGCALLTFALSYFINPYGYAFITNIIGAVSMFLFYVNKSPYQSAQFCRI